MSERGCLQLYAGGKQSRVHPRMGPALAAAGFNVASFASNHTLDWGPEAMLDTLDVLDQNRIAVIGAGRNAAEAHRPATIDKNGVRVAFLGYSSVSPKGYEAGADKPGCAVVRASTFYEQIDWQAGTPPRIVTFANKDDLAAMVDDIKKARAQADVLVLSIHWGVHFVPALIADYQREVGHAAIDAGVDLILGHHAHILKGIEVYKGKVIFYSLCNFAMESPGLGHATIGKSYGSGGIDPEWSAYPFAPDSRKTIIAKCILSRQGVEKVSFLPVLVNRQANPQVVRNADAGFAEVLGYIKKIGKDQGLETRYSVDGDEVVVLT